MFIYFFFVILWKVGKNGCMLGNKSCFQLLFYAGLNMHICAELKTYVSVAFDLYE